MSAGDSVLGRLYVDAKNNLYTFVTSSQFRVLWNFSPEETRFNNTECEVSVQGWRVWVATNLRNLHFGMCRDDGTMEGLMYRELIESGVLKEVST